MQHSLDSDSSKEASTLPKLQHNILGRPAIHATREEKLANRRILKEDQKPIGRPKRFHTAEDRTESRRKPAINHKPSGRRNKYTTEEERVEARRQQQADYRKRKQLEVEVPLVIIYSLVSKVLILLYYRR